MTLRVDFPPQGVVELRVEFRTRAGEAVFVRPRVLRRNGFELVARVPDGLSEIVLQASGSGDIACPAVALGWSTTAGQILSLAGPATRRLITRPRVFVSSVVWFLERMALGQAVTAPAGRFARPDDEAYERWRELFDEKPETDRPFYLERAAQLRQRPKFSILAVADDPGEVERIVAAVGAQVYPEWELILSVPPGLEPAARADTRIMVAAAPETSIPERLNAGLASATGAFVLPWPKGGVLRANALQEAALAIEAEPAAVLLYGDEDRVTEEGRRHSPRFKPAWSPHLAECHDYIGDPVFIATRVARSAGGWRPDIRSAAEHDLKLRVGAGRTCSCVHIPKILLHRTGPDREDGAGSADRIRAVSDALALRNVEANVRPDGRSPHPRIVRTLRDPPLVSVIIPTRDRAEVLRLCVTSLLSGTAYPRMEILIVDNGSTEPATKALFGELAADSRIRILPRPGPFNFSSLNNAAADVAQGSVLVLLNNDVEAIAEDWLHEMVGLALEPDIGCVGAKLYYPDGTIQHAGIVTGLLGAAGHIDKHAAREERGYLDRLVSVRDVSAVTAACLVVRKVVYDEVGGLDEEEFAIAFNDVDFCLKVEAAGYRNVWTPFAELIHHESVSRGHDLRSRDKARRLARELLALERRWGPRLLADPYYSPHLARDTEAGGIRTS